jgi:hypothetical protein
MGLGSKGYARSIRSGREPRPCRRVLPVVSERGGQTLKTDTGREFLIGP